MDNHLCYPCSPLTTDAVTSSRLKQRSELKRWPAMKSGPLPVRLQQRGRVKVRLCSSRSHTNEPLPPSFLANNE